MEVKVGMLVTVCVGLLVGFIVLLGDCSTSARGDLFLDVDTTSDLKVGSPVKIAGVPAGKVEDIVYRGGKVDPETKELVWVRVRLRVDSEKIPTIHDDSLFYITTQGVLGEKYVEIDPGSPERPSLAAGAIRRGEPPLRLEVIAAQAGGLLKSVSKLVRDNEGALGDILRDTRETVASLKSAAAKVDSLVAGNESKLQGIIDELVAIEADARQLLAAANNAVGDGEELRRTIANAEEISGEVRSRVGPVVSKLESTLTQYSALAETGQAAVEDVRTGVVAGISDARKSLADVAVLTGKIRDGKGSLGALLADDEIYDDVREMLKDLKRHPWKFLWKE
jgi:phospholipid/cholesterol/gamma-HCH transport system substrate-binding protein